jgi:hypothetical protein
MGVNVNEISGCGLIEIYTMDGLHGEYWSGCSPDCGVFNHLEVDRIAVNIGRYRRRICSIYSE